MTTNEDTIRSLISSVSEPVLIVIPQQAMPDEEMIRIFKTMEDLLTKVEEKLGIEFDVLVESAVYFGGYNEMSDQANEQKEEETPVNPVEFEDEDESSHPTE